VLATGGFQGDAEMMARHVSPWSDRALLRASPLCTGDGLRLALAAGASVSSAMNAVYAHVMPAPPARLEPASYRALTQFYVERCVLLNMYGERFVDESLGDAACALALLGQPEARGFIVFDAARHRTAVREPFVPDAVTRDPIEAIRAAHGEVVEAASLVGLGALLQERGVPSGALRATITAFDTAARRGDGSELPIRRARDLHRCSQAPFFAVPVQPGVTFTEGGVKVNTECQALDRDGRPVPGLYVAGVDVGAISNVGYAGALSASLITGLRAGLHGSRWHDAKAQSQHRSS
jgi:succinate dehydrogenase/fumarate reductase flavoprotein subunit